MITDRTFAFALSLVTIFVVWWILSKKIPKVHVFLFGESKNPYIQEVTAGITKQCDLLRCTLQFVLYEDIKSNISRYHDAIAACPANILVVRICNEETLRVLRRVGKQAIVVASEQFMDILPSYSDVVLHVFNSETPEFSSDSVVIIPDIDFPPIATSGAVVAASSADEYILEQLLGLTKAYELNELYVYGSIPGVEDSNVQAGLKRMFRRIRTMPIMGAAEGKAAVSAVMAVMGEH